MGLTQQELESRLWAAANSLRGPVDPADFKAYPFPLLFFKWIFDTWEWEHAWAVAGSPARSSNCTGDRD
jgi:type I restriction enzyme M protein